ncbi:MAG: hypothetical protein ACRDJC_03105, partial [Thermomicrobiales bacterium]
GGLAPFAFVPNKLLLTTDLEWAARYRELLREAFADFCDRHRPRLELFAFDDILLVWDKPQR